MGNCLAINNVFYLKKQCIIIWYLRNKINEDLDIYVIIEKVKEINLLKELFLNKDQ